MEDRPEVLVLEDDEMYAALLAELLGEHFYVVTGRNGLQGIAICLEGGVAAVVTDIAMQDFDGAQMLAAFKKDPRLSAIPVFVVSTLDFTAEAQLFPQVRGTFTKSESAEVVVAAVCRELLGG